MTYHLRMLDLPASERPRERLLTHGAGHLSEAELLAVLLATGQGSGGLSASGLGQLLLHHLGDHHRDPLAALQSLGPTELVTIPGIGPAKAATILAAVELGKRVCQRPPLEQEPIDSPTRAAAALGPELMWAQQEQFAVLLLDVKHRAIASRVISCGTATETIAHPRDVFREAIRRGAVRLIVAHNHPSGEVEPSSADIQLTRQLLQAAQLLAIPLLDHLILGQGRIRSLRESTSLWQEIPQGD